LLAALGSCLSVGIHANAVARGITLYKVELELEGDINMGVGLRLMGFERCKVGRPSGIRHWISWENMPPGRSPMRQNNTSALSGLASFAKMQGLLTARRNEGCAEAEMTFEAFEVALGQAVRGLENELKSVDLARYDVDADAVMVDGKEWRKCLEQQPKT